MSRDTSEIKKEKKESRDKKLDSFAVSATQVIGSPQSLIAHTIFFLGVWVLYFLGVPFDTIMLGLTTLVSLEAIYLALFIQMSVNRQALEIDEIQEDIDEIQEDIDEIQEDVDEIQEDVEEIHEGDEREYKETLSHTQKVENKLQEIESLLNQLRALK